MGVEFLDILQQSIYLYVNLLQILIMTIMLGDKLCKTCKFSLRENVQIRSFSWFVFGHFSRLMTKL